jgi:hypothetical protein
MALGVDVRWRAGGWRGESTQVRIKVCRVTGTTWDPLGPPWVLPHAQWVALRAVLRAGCRAHHQPLLERGVGVHPEAPSAGDATLLASIRAARGD